MRKILAGAFLVLIFSVMLPSYVTDFWNIIDWSLIVLSFLALAMRISFVLMTQVWHCRTLNAEAHSLRSSADGWFMCRSRWCGAHVQVRDFSPFREEYAEITAAAQLYNDSFNLDAVAASFGIFKILRFFDLQRNLCDHFLKHLLA